MAPHHCIHRCVRRTSDELQRAGRVGLVNRNSSGSLLRRKRGQRAGHHASRAGASGRAAVLPAASQVASWRAERPDVAFAELGAQLAAHRLICDSADNATLAAAREARAGHLVPCPKARWHGGPWMGGTARSSRGRGIEEQQRKHRQHREPLFYEAVTGAARSSLLWRSSPVGGTPRRRTVTAQQDCAPVRVPQTHSRLARLQ